MKILLVCIFVASAFAADELAFPKGALLVFPSQTSNDSSSTTTTPGPQNDGKGNLEQLNADIMERLKQEVGSQQGVYHVYLPDGRLQKVQYTGAPINQDSAQVSPDSTAEKKENNGFTVVPKAVYFVQVPADRAQDLKLPQTPEVQNNTQQNNQTSAQDAQAEDTPVQYKQEAVGVNQAQYLPITVVTVDQLAQLRSAQPGSQDAGNSGKQEAAGPRNQADSSSQTPVQGPADPAKAYVASVRYSQVEPVTGPVYSYSPLVRILRYASD